MIENGRKAPYCVVVVENEGIILHLLFAVFGLIFFSILLPEPVLAQSGLKVPRFVCLKSDEVNARSGPGPRYPVKWVYRKEHLPMEVVDEFDQWRKLRDVDGEEAWVHQSLLSGRRYASVIAPEAVVHRHPSAAAPPIIRAEAGVLMALHECQLTWCRVQVDNVKGWIRKDQIWGVYADELLEP